jgi:hypothetical protein
MKTRFAARARFGLVVRNHFWLRRFNPRAQPSHAQPTPRWQVLEQLMHESPQAQPLLQILQQLRAAS